MMPTNPYQVLGPSVPPMLGRAALMGRIDNHLRKPSPDHVSVVGPAHYGKSVLLRHVAHSYGAGAGGYVAASYVDLRHPVPTSDREFMRRLATEIKTVLQAARSPLAEWIEEDAGHEELGAVLDELHEGERLLAVLDGFDYALAGTGLTRNLWDQLRTLAQKSSLRLVTGSRKPLRETCRTEESRTSDFWGIFFDAPVRVGALDDGDLNAFLQPLRDAGCEFDEPARKEVANWTGGVPLLVVALLQKLWEDHRGKRCSKPEIDEAAAAVLDRRRELFNGLWDDCDVELRADLGTLSCGYISLTDLSDVRRRALKERGFGTVSGNRLRSSCRLMQRYASDQAPAIADLTRLLGTAAGFQTHVQTMLELRLKHVSERAIDERLRDFVTRAIRDIAPVPGHAVIWARSIAERTLAVIWDKELPRNRRLPAEWTETWNDAGVDYPHDQGTLPRASGMQCKILRLATGTDRRTTRCTRYVTKPTFLLLDHVQSVGNFGQHPSDSPEVTVGFAAAFLFSAISLVECLARDLAGATGPNR